MENTIEFGLSSATSRDANPLFKMPWEAGDCCVLKKCCKAYKKKGKHCKKCPKH